MIKKSQLKKFYQYEGIAVIDDYNPGDALSNSIFKAVSDKYYIQTVDVDQSKVESVRPKMALILNYQGDLKEVNTSILNRSILHCSKLPSVNLSNTVYHNSVIDDHCIDKLVEHCKTGITGVIEEFNSIYTSYFQSVDSRLRLNYYILLISYFKFKSIINFPFSEQEVFDKVLETMKYHEENRF